MTSPSPVSPTMLPSAAVAQCDAMIRHFEGFRALPYWDATGHVWSIGFGFCTLANGVPVTSRTPALSLAECEALLDAKLRTEYLYNTAKILQGIAMTDGQLAAMGSFAWNEGVGRITTAGLPALLRRGDFAGAAAVMRRYNVSGGIVLPGLVTRRAQEGAVLMGASWPLTDPHMDVAHALVAAKGAPSCAVPTADDGTAALNDAEAARVG